MAANEKLTGVLAKLNRAKKHIGDLEIAIESFLRTHPYKVGHKKDSQTGKVTYYVSEAATLPTEVSLVSGDAIHCLRSALDHLAFQLFTAAGARGNPKQVCFPIFDEMEKFVASARGKVQGISDIAFDVFQSIQPYKGGQGDALWRLHELNNADKHRLLIATGFAFALDLEYLLRRTAKDVLGESNWTPDADTYAEVGRFLPVDACIEPGHELFTDDGGYDFDENIEFRFDIAFNEVGIVEAKPILPTLNHFVSAVDGVVRQLSPFA